MKRLFTEHPASVGESYFDHLRMASSFAWRMVVGGLACLLHGLFPFLFKSTGSRAVTLLYDRMVINRSRNCCSQKETDAQAGHASDARLV